ncbi:hypothetical protein HYN48_08245 [Flavobacterium magnum]|uniref:Uncharacterized protein n=1 Tax=Flavobacterium magnum TaxID=2162713 RepID=A0A2S0REW6_9FLAO|nr:hypothetical protein HYN48_08245 [Flavobacterium magnum]
MYTLKDTVTYSIKVWLSTALAAPLLLFLILGIAINGTQADEIVQAAPMLGFMVVYGLLLSIPAMIVFWLIGHTLFKRSSYRNTKSVLSVYGLASVWVSFYFFDKGLPDRGPQQYLWVLIYACTMLGCVWIVPLRSGMHPSASP